MGADEKLLKGKDTQIEGLSEKDVELLLTGFLDALIREQQIQTKQA